MAAELSTPTPITTDLLRGWSLPVPGTDKESRGRTLVVGGTAHTPGVVLLAAEAVLRAGAGKLQVTTTEPVAAALAVALPEALVVPLPTTRDGSLDPADAADRVLELAGGVDAVLLGPGFSDVDASRELLEALVPRLEGAAVLDALASAYVTAHRDGLRHLDGRAVLTLNPDELAKTLDVPEDRADDDPVAAARELAEATGSVVLCGGQGKAVAAPDGRTWTCDAGGPGLGVSGSGDVQAGLVAGLLSRGADPAQAACWGGHLHALAGDELAARVGTVGFLAREIAGCVPHLLDHLAGS
ncbi:MAG: NAD(P)H-hydrate dehydratase [Oryzihumus sp.]